MNWDVNKFKPSGLTMVLKKNFYGIILKMIYNPTVKKEQFPLLQHNISLAPLTTLQVGGSADFYYILKDIDELPVLLYEAKKSQMPVFILGGGSNTIFADGGFRGLVIHMKANTIKVEGDRIIADAGALLSQVLQASLKHNLTGMERLMGLPGTVGGAVRGNAGAFGTETKDLIEKALIYNEKKGIHEVFKDYFEFSYRTSLVKKNPGIDTVLRVFYKLSPANNDEAMQETLQILKSRAGKQPIGKTSGSFFKNPSSETTAGYLLDQAECKGLQVGQAKVSDLHANWIMNLGGATQKDVVELAKIMCERVREKFQIILEPEVQFVGEKGMVWDVLKVTQ